ncbi:MAG: uracil-DNA glycosylase family protein [Pseudomonadota bacterium]
MTENSAPDPSLLTADALQGYWRWWQDLGVDSGFTETPGGWLDEPVSGTATKTTEPRSTSPSAAAAPKRAPKGDAAPPAPDDSSIALPESLEAMLPWWVESEALQTRSGIGPRLPPTLRTEPKLLLVSDMPCEDDSDALFSGSSGAMLDAIMQAIGLSREQCAFVSILPQYCADPEAELAARPLWRKLVAHQMVLLQPQTVMLCSKIANIAVTGNDLAENRRSLRFINHDGSNMPASASFHPRILASKPAMKRAAWRDWLRLKGQMDVQSTGRN